ncbi:MAG: hypothetical protein FE78DRAFT_30742 [Acidomyces sp. 'richmondensis']|nr:MAG: hypothetical protein FE78DRAFT_30742 [Acidomyces sp. 'richmondensis']
MVMFRRGLKDSVKDELMRDGRTNKDLDELIRTAIDLDNKLYERNIERRHDTREEQSQNESELGNGELNVTERLDADQFPNNEDCEDTDTPEESGEEAPTANLEERPLPEESSGSEELEEEEGGESVLMHFTVIGH